MLPVALEPHLVSIWSGKHAYFSLFHNIYLSAAAKTAVSTFLYNSTLDHFQWAEPCISAGPAAVSSQRSLCVYVTAIRLQRVLKKVCDLVWAET